MSSINDDHARGVRGSLLFTLSPTLVRLHNVYHIGETKFLDDVFMCGGFKCADLSIDC